MQTLLKEKTARQRALTVCDEAGHEARIGKTKGVAGRARLVIRLLIQTDC